MNKQADKSQEIYTTMLNLKNSSIKELEKAREAINQAYKKDDMAMIESLREELEPLAIDTKLVVNITLAWGGPSYGYELTVNRETKEVESGLFYYADWFTYDQITLSTEELQEVVSMYQGELMTLDSAIQGSNNEPF